MKLRKIMPDHQKNMIVANASAVGPAGNHSRAFKKKQTMTPQVGMSASKAKLMARDKSLNSILKETLGKESYNESLNESEAPESPNPGVIRRVLPVEKHMQRIPDTEHLSRMRALLVAAHTNDAFIKKLATGNSYVPANLDPEGSKEMGASFS